MGNLRLRRLGDLSEATQNGPVGVLHPGRFRPPRRENVEPLALPGRWRVSEVGTEAGAGGRRGSREEVWDSESRPLPGGLGGSQRC